LTDEEAKGSLPGSELWGASVFGVHLVCGTRAAYASFVFCRVSRRANPAQPISFACARHGENDIVLIGRRFLP